MSKPVKVENKGLKSERLQSRFAKTTVTGGDPLDRHMGNYAKKAAKRGGGDSLEAGMAMPSLMFVGR
mgnify:CR=1 FL=1